MLRRDVLTGKSLAAAVRADDELCEHIPTHLLQPVYRRSMRLKDKQGRPVYWDGRAMLQAWDEHLAENEGRAEDRGRPSKLALAASSVVGCPRCGFWKTVPGGCDHSPLTEDERAEIERETREMVLKAVEAVRMAPERKSAPPAPKVEKPSFFTCNACGRHLSGAYVFEDEQECEARLPGGEVCPGHMQALR